MLKYQKLIFSTSKKKSHVWYLSHVSDHYVKESIRLNYRSRAAFKLQHMQDSHNLINSRDHVLDLGSSPGGWSQVASELTKSTAENVQVVSVDLQPQKAILGVTFIQGDIKSAQTMQQVTSNMSQIDCILSDMAPNFTGNINDDHINICYLNMLTMMVAIKCLSRGGSLVMKTLSGPQENEYYNFYSKFFKTFSRDKPLASKNNSSELFFIGKQFGKHPDYMDLIKQIVFMNDKFRSMISNTKKFMRE